MTTLDSVMLCQSDDEVMAGSLSRVFTCEYSGIEGGNREHSPSEGETKSTICAEPAVQSQCRM